MGLGALTPLPGAPQVAYRAGSLNSATGGTDTIVGPNGQIFVIASTSTGTTGGVGTIAAAFYPKPVIIRLSDFKTNEYARLLGGSAFEPAEENPMIGFRGASRYYDKRYCEGFALECQALKRVREDMGFTNIIVMIPFCRTVDEGRRVLAAMARHGLVRGKDGLAVWAMCEIPSNVVLAEEFLAICAAAHDGRVN